MSDDTPASDDDGREEEREDEQDGGQKQDQAIRDVVRGAGIVYVGLVLEMGVAFLAQWIAANVLSVSDFGGVTTGVAVLNMGAIVASLGLGNGLTRYLPRFDETERAAVARGSIGVTFVLSLILGVVVVLNAQHVASLMGDARIAPSIQVFAATIPLATLLTVAIGGIRGQKQSRYRVYVENLLRPLSRFALVLVATVVAAGQMGFASAYAVPYWLGGLLALFLFDRALPGTLLSPQTLVSDIRRQLSLVGDILRYSLPFILSSASSFIYRSSDIFLLIWFIGSDAVGVYGVAYAAARLVLMFSTAFNFLNAPVASELEAGSGIEATIGVQRTVMRWLVVLSIPTLIPFVVFPEVFISGIYRDDYVAGAFALAVLTVGFTVHNVLSAQSNILKGAGYSKPDAINSFVGAVVNVSLNLLLIPRYGIAGAAAATTVSYLVIDGLLVLELWYITDQFVLTRSELAPVVVAGPLLAFVWYLKPFVPGTFPWLIVVTTVFGLIYAASCIITLGFNDDEVMLVRSIEERYDLQLGPITTIVERFS